MDFVRYAEGAARLVNADLGDVDALIALVADRDWLPAEVTERDATVLRRFQRDLRPVFERSAETDVRGVVTGINQLLERHPITPCISDHDPSHLHIHVAPRAATVADQLVAESLLGLAMLVCDLGGTRLGICQSPPCVKVFVDTSPNQSRRYCSDRCSSRANVAAYRARQRVLATH